MRQHTNRHTKQTVTSCVFEPKYGTTCKHAIVLNSPIFFLKTLCDSLTSNQTEDMKIETFKYFSRFMNSIPGIFCFPSPIFFLRFHNFKSDRKHENSEIQVPFQVYGQNSMHFLLLLSWSFHDSHSFSSTFQDRANPMLFHSEKGGIYTAQEAGIAKASS